MTTQQIVLYGILFILVALFARRYMRARSVPRYSPAQLLERLKEGPVVLLDVRTPREHQAGNIRGSVLLPLQELSRRIEELTKYKDREIVCYCQSGNRSLAATLRLRKQGFHAVNLEGGYAEWQFARLTEKG